MRRERSKYLLTSPHPFKGIHWKRGNSILLMNPLCFKIPWLGCKSRWLVCAPWRPVTKTPGSQGMMQNAWLICSGFHPIPAEWSPSGICRPHGLSPSLSPLCSVHPSRPRAILLAPRAQGWEDPQSCSHHWKALSGLSIFHPHPVHQQEASVKLNDNFLQKWCLNAQFQCIIMAREPLHDWSKDVREMNSQGCHHPEPLQWRQEQSQETPMIHAARGVFHCFLVSVSLHKISDRTSYQQKQKAAENL